MTDGEKNDILHNWNKHNAEMGYQINEEMFSSFDVMCDTAFIFDDYINNISMIISCLICFGALFQVIFDVQKDNISYKNKIVIIVLQSVAFCFAGICVEYEIKYYEESSKDAWIMIILVAYVVVLNLTKRVI